MWRCEHYGDQTDDVRTLDGAVGSPIDETEKWGKVVKFAGIKPD